MRRKQTTKNTSTLKKKCNLCSYCRSPTHTLCLSCVRK
uniref:Uncharacterized protein n=1 Tax=Anguilla anguilla TaxID=7936 RepID=A0A0E9Q3R2_ANGAN